MPKIRNPTIEDIANFLGDHYYLDNWSDKSGEDLKAVFSSNYCLYFDKDKFTVQELCFFNDEDVGIFGAIEPGPVVFQSDRHGPNANLELAIAKFVEFSRKRELELYFSDFAESLSDWMIEED